MWLLEPSAKERNLAHIAMSHPDHVGDPKGGNPVLGAASLIPTLGSAPGYGSVALCAHGKSASRSRASAEAAMVHAIIGVRDRGGQSRLERDLREAKLWKSFQGTREGLKRKKTN